MPLFQHTIVQKYLKTQDETVLKEKWTAYKNHFLNPTIQENIRNAKEEQYQGEFLIDLFVNVLGYTKNPTPNFNLTTELKNIKDSKKADGGIIVNEKVIGVIELKGTNTTDLSKVEAQAFGYKNNQVGCTYVITSNFEKLRFYIDNAIEHLEFNLFQLTEEDFKILYLCLAFNNLSQDVPKRIKEESISQEDVITKKLYKDYSVFKRELFANLTQLNPEEDALVLFKKSQKLLDRFLFLFFAEDRHLLPPNSVRLILSDWNDLKDRDVDIPLYDRFKKYFEYLNKGYKGKRYDVFAYNGGLFKPDDILDRVKIDDALLYDHTFKLSEYDFVSEVDVNILGHIFENSLNELEEVQAELEGQAVDKSKTKRKKDGVFYTPKYITKYIVENTVGKLCAEQKAKLKLIEEDYTNDKRKQKKTIATLLQKLKDYRDWLLQLTICDPACGSGAFLNEALNFLIAEHKYLDELETKLVGGGFVFPNIKNSILENNIYGVDINEESVEIAKLSLWLRTAQPNRKLNDLSNNIKCGNSLIDDSAIAGDKAFNWQKEFPQVFAKGGFDVVIGNPPYVQLQKMKEESLKIKTLGYKTFESTGDLYCLFYEQGNNILRKNGVLGFITSNKWMRANYGKSLRKYFNEHTKPYLLIDLGSGIFASATVDSNLIFFEKEYADNNTFNAIDLSKETDFIDFSMYEKHQVEVSYKNDDIWSIESPLEKSIKQKIEKIGTPLKDWDIEIYRGILTGYNEAFIISREKRDELISQDPKSAEIIHPILRGRDIKRYGIEYSDLYLINCHNGYKDVPKIIIDDYSPIKVHLDEYYEKLEKRYDKGETPYNLRNCVYLDEFREENIFYPDIAQKLSFIFTNKNYLTTNTGYFLRTGSKYLNSLLNSKLINFYYKSISAQLGSNGVRHFTIYIEKIPIPEIALLEQQPFIEKADQMLSLNKDLQEVSAKFQRTLQRKFTEQLEKLSKKLEGWYELSFADFVKELKKKKIKLSLGDEAEWEDYFLAEQQKAISIKTQIDTTDKDIDAMVYELYGLSEDEIEIIEKF